MSTTRILAASILSIVCAAPALSADEMPGYRGFQLGATLASVAGQAGVNDEPRMLHQRPARIEELTWQPPATRGPMPQGDSVKKILFTFLDGQLFRMVVTYEPERTAGLTAGDMIASVSAVYGVSLLPATPIDTTASASSTPYNNTWPATPLGFDATTLGHWTDADRSIYLFRSPYQSTFGLVISSTKLDAAARAAAVEGARLDVQEAPQREADRLRLRAEDKRLDDAKARQANKATFRP
jgi:hypothetical protein